MAEIRFYQLQRTSLEKALPALLEKVMAQGKRAVVMAASTARIEALDQQLWTYQPNSFLPHGSDADGHAADQPIWLTMKAENPNAAEIVFLTETIDTPPLGSFTLCCDLFDGNDPVALQAARERWKKLKQGDHTLTYWQQNAAGAWQKQAE